MDFERVCDESQPSISFPKQKIILRSYRYLTDLDKAQGNAMHVINVKNSQVMDYMV